MKIFFNNGEYVNRTYDIHEFQHHIDTFLEKKNKLQNFSTSELVIAFDNISKAMTRFTGEDAHLIKKHNLGFLIPWLKKNNVNSTLINTFGIMDVFSISNETKFLKK